MSNARIRARRRRREKAFRRRVAQNFDAMMARIRAIRRSGASTIDQADWSPEEINDALRNH
jgi:hypothetical protein